MSGFVVLKEWSDSKGSDFNCLKAEKETKQCWSPRDATELPDIIPPKGLDLERQWYLYEHIREYCSNDESKDLTCPLPASPLSQGPITSRQSSPPDNVRVPKARATDIAPARKCRICHKTGHNARTCLEKEDNK